MGVTVVMVGVGGSNFIIPIIPIPPIIPNALKPCRLHGGPIPLQTVPS